MRRADEPTSRKDGGVGRGGGRRGDGLLLPNAGGVGSPPPLGGGRNSLTATAEVGAVAGRKRGGRGAWNAGGGMEFGGEEGGLGRGKRAHWRWAFFQWLEKMRVVFPMVGKMGGRGVGGDGTPGTEGTMGTMGMGAAGGKRGGKGAWNAGRRRNWAGKGNGPADGRPSEDDAFFVYFRNVHFNVKMSFISS